MTSSPKTFLRVILAIVAISVILIAVLFASRLHGRAQHIEALIDQTRYNLRTLDAPWWVRLCLPSTLANGWVSLVSVDATGQPDFDNEQLVALSVFPEIKCLCLDGTRITDDSLHVLRRFHGLEELYLSGTQITDSSLSHIVSVRSLKSLSLSQTSVTDAAVESLAMASSIESLNIQQTSISDRSVEWFLKMGELREIIVHSTRISRDGIVRLQKGLPKCLIIN